MDQWMGDDYEAGQALKNHIIPFAVRWYTGEAAPDMDDDDEDEESEDEDEDDDESEDESEDESPARGRNQRGRPGQPKKKPVKGSPKDSSDRWADGPIDPKEKEECKQQ